MGTVRKTFAFDREDDADLLAWLEELAGAGEASATVRAALYALYQAQGNGGPTLGDVIEEVRALGDRLDGLALAPAGARDPVGEEDPELAAALDGLGL